ncbi:MAG: AbrB family transcriptional regulator [Ruminococcaceae bacterium]|nr:AbrB family transcriptional regulator [Oscillospiraceae bacterium]
MQNSGIVRKVDELGRVVLPIEIRRIMGIGERDALVISINENEIVMRKHEPICLFCGSNRNLKEFRGKTVCAECTREMNK